MNEPSLTFDFINETSKYVPVKTPKLFFPESTLPSAGDSISFHGIKPRFLVVARHFDVREDGSIFVTFSLDLVKGAAQRENVS